jgi:hypothetical protein
LPQPFPTEAAGKGLRVFRIGEAEHHNVPVIWQPIVINGEAVQRKSVITLPSLASSRAVKRLRWSAICNALHLADKHDRGRLLQQANLDADRGEELASSMNSGGVRFRAAIKASSDPDERASDPGQTLSSRLQSNA